MDCSHLRQTLLRGTWSIEYNQEYTKQNFKKKKETEAVDHLPGREMLEKDEHLLRHARHLSESPGWHMRDDIGVHVAHSAKSFRSPTPRFCLKDFPLRTTLAEFNTADIPKWRILEEGTDLKDIPNLTSLLPCRARRLVSLFHKHMPQAT